MGEVLGNSANYKTISQNMMPASLKTADAVYAVLTPDSRRKHLPLGDIIVGNVDLSMSCRLSLIPL